MPATVFEELERLGGRLPERFEVRERVVGTPAGPHPVPPSVQALLAVVWPEHQRLRTRDEFDWEVRFGGFEVEAGLFAEELPRAWYGVGHDEGQHFYLVDLAEAADHDAPPVYRVDHEGGEPAQYGAPSLWRRLLDLRTSTPTVDLGRACVRGDVARVRRALAEGVGLGPLEESGLTPLHLAAISGSVETVEMLLAAGADPNAALTHMTDLTDTYLGEDVGNLPAWPFALYTDETPVLVALNLLVEHVRCRRVPDVLAVLLAAGADPNAATPEAAERGESEGWNAVDVAYHFMTFRAIPEAAVCFRMLRDAGGEPESLAEAVSRSPAG
ncbi:ankyrin repeat domain-containing protein [Yinghuangia sp. ASG 101]|uniref:ankyrin repeat domain-containing protein n=1 Tax=Yinghuangia sp. ASG 101 TaxID=2896848 RepID=UPI001E45D6BD|nr:ankyrin repeat domain-containing protein [Yinghuangia sp. ASG 101]UGQ11798.1 ankyrin repeat domain-containing protein [Yinghuangia sp. ASG 101]